jgi:uncharacterized protein YbjT (DUF2867 family)
METKTTLVLGGTGKTGSRLAQRLKDRQQTVRLGSRRGTPPFDWNDATTWPAALKGVDSVYLSYYPDLAAPGATEAIAAITPMAVKSGVRRLVLLSGRNEPEAQRCEEIVRQSGVEWTVIRASWFAQNFSEGYLLEPLLAGEVALPAGNVGEPFIDTDDIADVAVAALTEDGHVGKLYEVTGPRLLTFAEAIAEIAKASGRPIRYRQLSLPDFRAALERDQVPREFVDLLMYLFGEVLDGRSSSVTSGVQQALGRPPRDFSEYVRKTAATGVWNPAGNR